MTIILYDPVLSCKNIVKIPDVLCSQSESSWLIKDQELRISCCLCSIIYFSGGIENIPQKKTGLGKQRMWFTWQVQSHNLMSSESGLEGLETSLLF